MKNVKVISIESHRYFLMLFVIVFGFITIVASGGGDGDDDSSSDSGTNTITFNCVISDYEHGYGVEGQDEITIQEITGPSDATVEDPTPGEYVVIGQYKLNTYDSAKISVSFLGTSEIGNEVSQKITRGEGSFEVKNTLIQITAGSGNLILDMAGESGDDIYSNWMFRVMPTTEECED